jgi:NADH-quinone oxidoreductase subunit N
MGKYFLFAAAVGQGMPLLALAGALNSVISLFYYFRIGKAVFLDEGPSGAPALPPSGPLLVLAAAALALLVLGVAPSLVGSFAVAAGLGK